LKKLINLSNETVVASNVNEAFTFFRRLRGLMFTEKLHSGSGLHIKPCRSVHTYFMKYAIDILYVNASGTVVAIDEGLQPGKVGRRCKEAVAVVELPVGVVKATKTEVGHNVRFI
jgi:uncharacterized membrane protein (UPF0127 family)